MRGFTSIEKNNLNPVLAKILIKREGILVELMAEVPINLERVCITLSMGASNFQS